MDFFTKNDLEKCGATIFQDGYGIIYQTFIRGRRSQRAPAAYEPATIVLSCFYPLTNTPTSELPTDIQAYMRKEYEIGESSIQLKSFGKLKTSFDLYDVRTNHTGQFYPHTDRDLYVNVGGPIIVGVVPTAIWENGININPIFRNSGTLL